MRLLDMASTHSYILDHKTCSAEQVQSKTHKDFMVELLSSFVVWKSCSPEERGQHSHRHNHRRPPETTKDRLKGNCCHQVVNQRAGRTWRCPLPGFGQTKTKQKMFFFVTPCWEQKKKEHLHIKGNSVYNFIFLLYLYISV